MLPVYSYRVAPRTGGYVVERTGDDPANHYARWALVARAATHEEALELLESYERDPPLRGPSAVPWVEVDTEVMPDGSAPIRLSRSVRVF